MLIIPKVPIKNCKAGIKNHQQTLLSLPAGQRERLRKNFAGSLSAIMSYGKKIKCFPA